MDMGSLLQMGADVFKNSSQSGDAGSGLDTDMISTALAGLTGSGAEGGLDLGALLGKMQGSGMADMAASFLGDGENNQMSISNITDLLGSDKIAEFASKLGLSEEQAAGGLSDALPQLMDKASSGGSILDSIGGVSGALGLAGKLFGR
jgi:uncharacterized protein YidB (DUF937 family)